MLNDEVWGAVSAPGHPTERSSFYSSFDSKVYKMFILHQMSSF